MQQSIDKAMKNSSTDINIDLGFLEQLKIRFGLIRKNSIDIKVHIQ
jgi:hypothetical protein